MAGKSKITSNLKINIDYEIENSQKIRKEIEKILNSGNFSDSINRDLQKKIDTLKKVEKELSDEGRIFVRPSGTQSLLRVMTEAPTQELADKYCEEVAKVVEEEMGSN